MRTNTVTKTFLLACIAAVLLAGCSGATAPEQMQMPTPVVGTLELTPYTVTYKTELVGRTTAFYTAEVRPQVSGIILERLFEEGSMVEQGQQLYQIDPEIYQASLNSANAALQRAQASYQSARLLAERYASVVKVNGVSKQQYDDAIAARNQADAEVQSAKAAVETARINLEYTKLLSPVSGHIGQSSVTKGALVTANQAQPLATVQQLDKMYVDVSQSSIEILRLKKALAEGSVKATASGGASVELILEDGSVYRNIKDGNSEPIMGELQFSDVTVDPSTGMVKVRAIFPNPDGLLFPGMYVRAILQEGVIENAMIVPQQAVSRDTSGRPTALVVVKNPKAGQTNERTGQPESEFIVEMRILTVDKTIDSKHWLVTSGLSFGEMVLMEGSQKVRPGGAAIPKPVEENPISESDTIRAAAKN